MASQDPSSTEHGSRQNQNQSPVLIAVIMLLVIVVIGLVIVVIDDNSDQPADAADPVGSDSSDYWDGPTGSASDAPTEAEDAEPMTVNGKILVAGGNTDQNPFKSCTPRARHSEIASGVAVRLFDDNDTLMGKGVLSGGFGGFDKGFCQFGVAIEDIPTNIPGYWVQVGSSEPRYVEHHPDGITKGGPADLRDHFSLTFK